MRDLEVREISNATVIDKLASFSQTDTYSIIYNLWLKRREEIVARAKMDKDPVLWARLDGFDRAATIVTEAVTDFKRRKNEKEEEEEI